MSLVRTCFLLAFTGIVYCRGQIQFPEKKASGNSVTRNVPGHIPQSTAPDKDQNNPEDKNNPEARFLFGGLGLPNLLDPCRFCDFNNPEFANNCCLKGARTCCQFSGFGFPGTGNVIPPFGFPGVGGPGPVVPPPFGFPGFGGAPSPGFVPGGFPFPGGNPLFGLQKPGFCPKPSLFSGFQFPRSSSRSKGEGSSQIPFSPADKPKTRNKRQDQKQDQNTKTTPATRNGGDPQSRFFCRDKCFRDFDCPNVFKCCMNLFNCRVCSPPGF